MYRYAVIGAGLQGTAADTEFGLNGRRGRVLLIDACEAAATLGAQRVNALLKKDITQGLALDARDTDALAKILVREGVRTMISAAHYDLNEKLTAVAVQAGLNMCDLGGNTDVVRRQHSYHGRADDEGITIVPDCGMGPGLNISLGMCAMSMIKRPRDVYIWDGGLPQKPEAPWNYSMTFNIRGLTNEYAGHAAFLRDGKVLPVPALSELETVNFPETLGTLEAAVTSGGLSTAPWTMRGKLERLENKTLRYPGHWAQMQVLAALGLFGEKPVQAGDATMAPREMLHALWGPQITKSEVRDVCVIRTQCDGTHKDGSPARSTLELIDYYDPATGFTAMQRLTGWHASIVAILCAQDRLPSGIVPVETIPGTVIISEMEKRGFTISKRIDF